MIGFRLLYGGFRYTVTGFDPSTAVLTIRRVEYAEGNATPSLFLPLEDARFIYRCPNSEGEPVYYSTEDVPLSVGRSGSYYMQLPGNGRAGFIGEQLLDLTAEERREWSELFM